MRARFNSEDRIEREVEQLSRLVFPPFQSHHHKPTGRFAGVAGFRRAQAEGAPRILFIEDDPFIADMYTMALELGGEWSVQIARDGIQGLRHALSDPPSLILLDLLLPRMDGFEVLRQLRANESTRNTPVLIVSNASGLGGRADEARKLGIVDWVVKANTTPAALTSKVRRILGS